MRDIFDIINQIKLLIPLEYKNREELNRRLDYIINDTGYRAPELIGISWKDVHILLCQYIIPELTDAWTWADDVFELFSDGAWSKYHPDKIKK